MLLNSMLKQVKVFEWSSSAAEIVVMSKFWQVWQAFLAEGHSLTSWHLSK